MSGGPMRVMVSDKGFDELERTLGDMRKGTRGKIMRKSMRESIKKTTLPASKRNLSGITSKRTKGRGAQVSMTRAIMRGMTVRAGKRSRRGISFLLYPPKRERLEKLSRGRFKAWHKGFPPTVIEWGRGRGWRPAYLSKAGRSTVGSFVTQFGRMAEKQIRAELRKVKA